MQFSFNELLHAYLTCKQNKTNKPNHIIFENNLEENLYNLYEELNNRTYQIDKSIYFILTKPKYREVWAASFKDRIVHHLIYNRLSPHYFKTFIYDSCACIPNKGTLFASNRVNHFIKSCSNNYQKETYYLKADIKNFFNSIDKDILWNLISNHPITIEQSKQFGNDNYFLELIHQVIFHNPTNNYQFNGNPNLINNVPHHKQLFNVPLNKGLPIGNLTSQFFANIYLDGLDKYIKHQLKMRYYARYVDDIILIHNNPQYLLKQYEYIKEYLETNNDMFFHKNKTSLNNVEQGVDFVGRIMFPHRILIRNRTIGSFKKKINDINIVSPSLISSYNSYLGMMIKSNSYNIRKDIITTKLLPLGLKTTSNYNKIII